MAPTVEVPARFQRGGAAHKRAHWEQRSWFYMRASGALLMILIFTHLFTNLMVGDGISAVDFGFVAGKWASPLWKWWDLAMLWLAMIHGSNGMRVIVNDYARRTWLRVTLKVGLVCAFAVTVILGTLVIFTFDPCPTGGDPSLLPSFCEGL